VDFGADVNWKTAVRDNYGPLKAAFDAQYADGPLTENGVTCPGPCRLDFNGDRQLWVQAKATVRGRQRHIVARLKLEQLRESVPQAGVVAGMLQVTNSGNKEMLNSTGSSIILRCDPATMGADCLEYESSKNQLTPAPQSTPSQPPFMTAEQLKRFKARAQTDGTYFSGCPTNASQLSGAVVWVESCTTSYATLSGYQTPCVVPGDMSTNCINNTSKPGLLIWHCGTIEFTAGQTFYGIMYLVNNSDNTCSGWTAKSGCSTPVYSSSGGGGVLGALVADGNGCITVGSNSLNMKFDANVFNSVTSYGTVGLVQNTWRELKAGS
jgi:hypothetical protein